MTKFLFLPILMFSIGLQAQTITTVAGSGSASYADGSPAITKQMDWPSQSVIYNGKLYFTDYHNNRVRMFDPSGTGTLSTIAGTGTASSTGDGGNAASATLNGPDAIAITSSGIMYITEDDGCRIRKVILSTNIISTYAGTGTLGYSGDGAAATAAKLNNPDALAVDASGNLYVGDYGNYRIRKITTAGIISTIIGNGTAVATGDGGAASAAETSAVTGLQFDNNGNLFFSAINGVIRKITMSTNIVTAYAGVADALSYSGDGGAATAASFYYPTAIAFDASNNMFITDENNNAVREINASTNIISTYAGTGNAGYSGDGGNATSANLNAPFGIAFDAIGGLYISDRNNNVIRYVTNAVILPLKLSDFSVSMHNNIASIDWTTTNEVNTAGFEVERSADNGTTYSTVANVAAASTSGTHNYSSSDNLLGLSGNIFYRLKMIDKNGKFTYSNIEVLTIDAFGSFTAAPNPFATSIQICTTASSSETVSIRLYGSNGALVYSAAKGLSTGTNVFSINLPSLASGIYYLEVVHSNGTTEKKQLVHD